jgi:hypothetical protein
MHTHSTAGHSVRQTSRRIYGNAASKALWATLLLGAGVATANWGAPDVSILLTGFGLLLVAKAWRLRGSAKRYRLGAAAEERVGALLIGLEHLGWLVEHDVVKSGGGNVDHVVRSRSVVFTIDTKRSRWHGQDLGQAHRHAAWAARRYGTLRRIVPVICIQRSNRSLEVVDDVYIVGAGVLVDFLVSQG